MPTVLLVSFVVVLVSGASARTLLQRGEPTVTLLRLPTGGIQPQVAADGMGVTHVVYFSGDAANGDLFYARVVGGTLSAPLRVNSLPNSAIATGTVRGARLTIGRNGRVHVAWNGSSRSTTKGEPTPMLYARMNDAQTGFEPQRNLVQFAAGLDGGGAIAADSQGRVFVAWHAGGPDSKGEGDRRVWLTSSTDDGSTFSRERSISNVETGACGCCGMDGVIDAQGRLYFLYRSAREVMNRDSYLLTSTDSGRSFRSVMLQPWGIGACPMSTYDLATRDGRVLAAWETGGHVQYAEVTPPVANNPPAIAPPGATGSRRHPSLAINAQGDVLMSWSEGTGWQKGGSIAWQVFDRRGNATTVSGRADGLQVWSLSAAFAKPDGGFTIIY
jgi:hypothetical protein